MQTEILLSHDQGKKHIFYFISKPVIYHSFYSIYSHDIFNIADPSRVQDRRKFLCNQWVLLINIFHMYLPVVWQ